MKFSAVLVSAILVSVVSGGPIYHRQSQSCSQPTMTMSPPSGKAVGGAYFMTNEPDGNFLVAADIGSDGQLTLRTATYTGGNGAHGTVKKLGPDALFSQGSVKASASGKIVAAVNAGSNTVSVFRISPKEPSALTMMGKPVNSGGEFPMSLAINKAGNTVCALNGGAKNGVNCYKVNPRKGLVAIPNTMRSLNLNQTTPPTGPAGTTSHIIFSEDGSQLIASVKGAPPTPGFLAVWDIAQDGSLSQNFKSIAPAQGGLLPFSMTAIPGTNSILATDAGLGFDIFAFSNSTGESDTQLSSANPIEGQGATCWSSFSAKTGNFYLTDIGTSMVTEVNVDQNMKSTIVMQYAQGNNSGTIDNDVAAVGNNSFLYVLAANATSIDVLSLAAPGQATSLQRVDIAGPARAAGLDVDPDNLQGMTTFLGS